MLPERGPAGIRRTPAYVRGIVEACIREKFRAADSVPAALVRVFLQRAAAYIQYLDCLHELFFAEKSAAANLVDWVGLSTFKDLFALRPGPKRSTASSPGRWYGPSCPP